MKKTMTAVAVLALSTSLAFAAPYDGYKRGRGGEARFEKFAEKLNLSDAQKQQIKAINEQFRSENAAFLQNFRQTMQDFRAARRANDQARVDALRPTIESQRAQMKQLRDAKSEKIRAVLTAEQNAQLDAWKAQRESRRHRR